MHVGRRTRMTVAARAACVSAKWRASVVRTVCAAASVSFSIAEALVVVVSSEAAAVSVPVRRAIVAVSVSRVSRTSPSGVVSPVSSVSRVPLALSPPVFAVVRGLIPRPSSIPAASLVSVVPSRIHAADRDTQREAQGEQKTREGTGWQRPPAGAVQEHKRRE